MARAPKVCGHHQCANLVPAGTTYCAEHERQRGWRRNTGVTRTDTAAHRARRQRVLARDRHECQLRYDGICTGTAAVCDHIVALAEGGSDTDANCQAACMRATTARPAWRATGRGATADHRVTYEKIKPPPQHPPAPRNLLAAAMCRGQRHQGVHEPSGRSNQLM